MKQPLKIDLLVDSGAFSAWRKQDPIHIEEYADYLLENKKYIKDVVNLDVIPGRFAEIPTLLEVEEAATKGWSNLKYLEGRGISAIPVFHQGEDFKWLFRMIDKGYDYIGISPDNGKYLGKKREWLDKVFREITNEEGLPIVKTHGFAVTSIDLLNRYPWATADSMSWVIMAAFGGVLVPKHNNGEFDYGVSPYMVHISSKSSMKEVGKHFANFGETTRKHIIKFFESENFSLEQVSDDFYFRSVINLRVFRRAELALRNPKFEEREYDIINGPSRYRRRSPVHIIRTRIIFAVNLSAPYSTALNIEKVNERLFSYYLLKETKPDFLKKYAKTGEISVSGNKGRQHEPLRPIDYFESREAFFDS